MRITAIVPTLDEEARLPGCLDSLHAAGVDDIVVADGGSRDRTVQIARAAGCTISTGRRGRALQSNRGALRASGDVLWFVHADTRVPPTARQQIERALARPWVVGGAFGTRTVNDGPPHPLQRALPLADFRSRYTRLPYGDQGLFVRRTVFERVGGYPALPIFEDVELARRLWAEGPLRRVPAAVEVSGRRFLSRPAYYTLVMYAWPPLYRLGMSPSLLARLYGNVR